MLRWHHWKLIKNVLNKIFNTWRPSDLQKPLTVLVGAMVTTGGVLVGGPKLVPMAIRFGVPTGEMWLVTGEETCDDSLLMEPERKKLVGCCFMFLGMVYILIYIQFYI